jgi:hypothetical protein
MQECTDVSMHSRMDARWVAARTYGRTEIGCTDMLVPDCRDALCTGIPMRSCAVVHRHTQAQMQGRKVDGCTDTYGTTVYSWTVAPTYRCAKAGAHRHSHVRLQ